MVPINDALTLWEKPGVLFCGLHTELELPLRKQVDWSRRKKEKEKREHGDGASWLTAQRGQRSVPWGYASLTPPQNEIDPLSESTSCQCLRAGKNSRMAPQEKRSSSLYTVRSLCYRTWINILQSLAVVVQAISLVKTDFIQILWSHFLALWKCIYSASFILFREDF